MHVLEVSAADATAAVRPMLTMRGIEARMGLVRGAGARYSPPPPGYHAYRLEIWMDLPPGLEDVAGVGDGWGMGLQMPAMPMPMKQ